MSHSRRSRVAKVSRRNWTTHKSALLGPGAIYGELKVINPDTGKRKNGHRMALVEDIQTGEQKEVRVDNLISGNTQSCGRIKKERYKEKLAKMIPETDLDGIDPAVLATARAWPGVDALTGERIELNGSAERKGTGIKDECRLQETKQREQEQQECELVHEDTKILDEHELKIQAQTERWSMLPRIVHQAKPYLIQSYGIVSFEKVPRDLRSSDVREAMEAAGLIDRKVRITAKGADWFLSG